MRPTRREDWLSADNKQNQALTRESVRSNLFAHTAVREDLARSDQQVGVRLDVVGLGVAIEVLTGSVHGHASQPTRGHEMRRRKLNKPSVQACIQTCGSTWPPHDASFRSLV